MSAGSARRALLAATASPSMCCIFAAAHLRLPPHQAAPSSNGFPPIAPLTESRTIDCGWAYGIRTRFTAYNTEHSSCTPVYRTFSAPQLVVILIPKLTLHPHMRHAATGQGDTGGEHAGTPACWLTL
jgi:hypothetical protein